MFRESRKDTMKKFALGMPRGDSVKKIDETLRKVTIKTPLKKLKSPDENRLMMLETEYYIKFALKKVREHKFEVERDFMFTRDAIYDMRAEVRKITSQAWVEGEMKVGIMDEVFTQGKDDEAFENTRKFLSKVSDYCINLKDLHRWEKVVSDLYEMDERRKNIIDALSSSERAFELGEDSEAFKMYAKNTEELLKDINAAVEYKGTLPNNVVWALRTMWNPRLSRITLRTLIEAYMKKDTVTITRLHFDERSDLYVSDAEKRKEEVDETMRVLHIMCGTRLLKMMVDKSHETLFRLEESIERRKNIIGDILDKELRERRKFISSSDDSGEKEEEDVLVIGDEGPPVWARQDHQPEE